MAHYALLDQNNFVTSVIVGKDENEDSTDWEAFYSDVTGKRALRTSYNTRGNVHYKANFSGPSEDQSKALRKNFAGIGYRYDEEKDAFIPQKPVNYFERMVGADLGFMEFNNSTYLWEIIPGANVSLKSSVLSNYTNEVFIETGTHDGNGVQVALDCGFEKIYTVDIGPERIVNSSTRFANEITSGTVEIFEGNSENVLPQILSNVTSRATIWLDDHTYIFGVDGNVLVLLDAISNHPIKNHTILINDWGMFDDTYRYNFGYFAKWCDGVTSQQILDKITSINPNYTFSYERGYIPGNILCAKVG